MTIVFHISMHSPLACRGARDGEEILRHPRGAADQSAVEAAITAATSPLATSAALATVDGIADSILEALSRPFELMGRPVGISASIGIALSPEHGDDEKQLLRRADEAMYAAKHGGGGRVHR